METQPNAILHRIKNVIRKTDPNAVAILYGSRATGKARKDSDWDILILLDKPTVSFKDEELFRHNLYDVELEIGEPISTLIYSANDWNTKLTVTPLYEAVKKNGIIL